jgi:pimeloyl-ACP methyl ester carboxylesterase
MNFIRTRWRKILILTALLIFLAAAGIIFWAGSQIASPSRRPLMGYHREFMGNPAAHGLVIDRFTASDGTPCLVCFPDDSGNLGDRGTKIRQQLTARGLVLKPAGPVWAAGTDIVYHGRSGSHLADIQPAKYAASIRIPTLIAHGASDRVSAVARGKCLYDSLPVTTPKKWIEIPAADHDNVLITAYPIYADIAGWMLRNVAGG